MEGQKEEEEVTLDEFDKIVDNAIPEASFRIVAQCYAAMYEELLKTMPSPVARDITVAHVEALGGMTFTQDD